MGLNSFSLFSGYGLGALAFEPLLKYGFSTALAVFASFQLCLAMLATMPFPLIPLIAGALAGKASSKEEMIAVTQPACRRFAAFAIRLRFVAWRRPT
jgi:hypothetical protein